MFRKLIVLGVVFMMIPIASAMIQDRFGRTESSESTAHSWGTADNGNTWTTSSAGTGEVNGSVGIYLPDATTTSTESVDLLFNETGVSRLDFRVMWDNFGAVDGEYFEIKNTASSKYNMYIRDNYGGGKMQNYHLDGAGLEDWNVGGAWYPKSGVWHNISIRDIQATTYDFYINGTQWGNDMGKFHNSESTDRLIVGSRNNDEFYIDDVCTSEVCPAPTATGDDCDYSGSGDWIISETCHVTENTKLETGKSIFIQSGATMFIDSGVTIT